MTEQTAKYQAKENGKGNNNSNGNIQTIKQRIDLESYLSTMGLTLKKSGSDTKTCPCPLCNHKDCFRVTPSKQLWHCFSCDQGGDIIELHQIRHNLTKADAILDLSQSVGIPIARASSMNQQRDTGRNLSGTPKSETGQNLRKTSQENIFNEAMVYYRTTAKTSPGFKQFLHYRKFNPAAINKLGLGYADGNLHTHLKARGVTDQEMIESKLVRKNDNGSLYDYFRYQIIYPTMGPTGDVIHLKGKGIDKTGRPTGKTWQLGNRDSFFNWHQKPGGQILNSSPKKDTLYIVEGENDAVALDKINRTAWAMGGTLSQKQIDILKQTLSTGGFDVCVIPDNDSAGENLLKKIKSELMYYTLPDTLRLLIAPQSQRITARYPATLYNDVDEAIRKTDIPPDFSRQNKAPLFGSATPATGEKPSTAVSSSKTITLESITRPAPLAPSLKTCLNLYRKTIEEQELKYSSNIVGHIVFELLMDIGDFFVIDEEILYIYQGNQYVVGSNLPFKSLMYQLSRGSINYADKQSKVIWESIQAQCYYKAPHTEHRGWIYTDATAGTIGATATPAIYYNLCNPKNEIIRITPGNIELLMNGCNDTSVFLQKSPKTRPIALIPMTDEEMSDGLQIFFDLFYDNMACDISWKIYILSFIVNSLFLNMAKAHGINKFTGHQGSGKTETAGMITALLYGQNFVTVGSTASDYTDAALNPVTICDNLEIHNITPDRRDFLLCVATGITRQKRKSGTDSANIYEKTVTQIITTSIESFEFPELIERAVTIPFDQEFFNQRYPGSMIIENSIIGNRDKILSAIFRLSTHILNNYQTKKEKIYRYLEKNHPKHSKRRLNEHLACMAVITDELKQRTPGLKQIFDMSVQDIVAEWINQQDKENTEIMFETNIIVRYLNLLAQESANGLLDEYHVVNLNAVADGLPEHPTDNNNSTGNLTMELTTSELLSAFELLAKKYNIRQRFSSVRHLAVRIRNELSVIEAAQWRIRQTRRVKGQNLFEISNC
ncbi:DNA primase, catalytic core [Desulfocicer vacuolatum DSM 3385]|uniref:DNA primase, catalytic core n=1 Tax=Desulfocicer vacuolatum DSM 3385 TaxID=1121400 RepID=A0A1W2B9X2_9BACT|nr:CHC2 zinc finger domain-containing protein [Desulfocicer vacuolatum]SMC69512.1 DNA primase, catalytic core [Desulfocicer vacuolatum DSM 3385]